MNSLKELADAVDFVDVKLPSGRTATIESWTVRFPPADPPRLPDRTLKSTYTSKPLVDVDGHRVFGELAIVRWLAKNGWRGLWADTFHGKKFWSGMPHRTEHVEPPPQVRAMYDRITREKGSPSGCFDVVAWKADRIIWLEYKGARDRPNQNEKLWIDAALRAGVSEDDLFFIGDTTNTRRSGKTGSTGGAKTSSHRRNTLSYSDKLDRRTIRSALKNRRMGSEVARERYRQRLAAIREHVSLYLSGAGNRGSARYRIRTNRRLDNGWQRTNGDRVPYARDAGSGGSWRAWLPVALTACDSHRSAPIRTLSCSGTSSAPGTARAAILQESREPLALRPAQ